MGKKILLISGFILATIFSGDALFLLTHSGLIANWGSIIIPSFVIAILWKLLLKDNLEDGFRFVLPLIMGITKLALFLITVQGPTLLATILMPVIYTVVAYLFISLGLKIVPDRIVETTE